MASQNMTDASTSLFDLHQYDEMSNVLRHMMSILAFNRMMTVRQSGISTILQGEIGSAWTAERTERGSTWLELRLEPLHVACKVARAKNRAQAFGALRAALGQHSPQLQHKQH